jgi:hypothetical protein
MLKRFVLLLFTLATLLQPLSIQASIRGQRPMPVAICLNSGWVMDRDSFAAALKVPPGSTVVFFTEDSWIATPSPRGGSVLRASIARGPKLVAFLMDVDRGRTVVVTTLEGVERARFRDAIGFAWSPDGPLLAVMRGTPPTESEEVPNMTGIAVWNATTGITRKYSNHAYQLGWINEDTLVVFDSNTFRELTLKTGASRPSQHRGTIVSPDHRYSVWISYEGTEVVWDSARQMDITQEVLSAAGSNTLTGNLNRPPFWITSSRSMHSGIRE